MKIAFLLAFLSSSAGYAASDVMISHVYDVNPDQIQDKGSYLFEVKTTTLQEGETEKVHVVAKDQSGKVYSEQMLTYQKGIVQEYTTKNENFQLFAKVTVHDNKVHYESTVKGKQNEGKDDLPDNFVIGPSMSKFIRSHATELAAGKEFKVEVGVPARATTIGFKLFKVDGEEKQVQEGKWIKVKFKPSSLIIASLVPTSYFYVDSKTGKIALYHGITDFRKPEDTGEKGFVGTVIYGE